MITINVYMDDGRVYRYTLSSEATAAKAREHAHAICREGYRHNNGVEFESYPAHRVKKVKVTGIAVPTGYPDTEGGT